MRSQAHTARNMGDRRRPRHMSATSGNRFWKRPLRGMGRFLLALNKVVMMDSWGAGCPHVPCQRCGFSPYCAPYVGGAACSLLRASMCSTAVRVRLPPPPHTQTQTGRSLYAVRLSPFCSFALVSCENEKLCAGAAVIRVRAGLATTGQP